MAATLHAKEMAAPRGHLLPDDLPEVAARAFWEVRMGKKVTIDNDTITEKEATRLMLHHLHLAQAYFEAASVKLEIILREIPEDDEINRVWATSMHELYDLSEEVCLGVLK